MGCACSRFEADGTGSPPQSASRRHEVHVHSAHSARDTATGWEPPRKQRIKHSSTAALQVLTPQQVLELAQRVLSDNFSGSSCPDGTSQEAACPSAVMLAAVALVASCGRRDVRHFREDVADTCIGLCQMLRSTARWLASDEGYSRYGTTPTGRDLETPEVCLYFGAAYLRFLSTYNGSTRDEGFVVRAFHAGPKQAHSDPGAEAFWAKYARAKQLLLLLQDALCERAAAAEAGSGASQCTMHVVQQGESIRAIAAICGTSVAAIMAANPELGGDERSVRANDCIAIPVPVVLPRLYAIQPGDTLHAIAKAHDCSVSRLMARNPQLSDPANVAPGWLLLAPGLRGDSMSTGSPARPAPAAAELPDVPTRLPAAVPVARTLPSAHAAAAAAHGAAHQPGRSGSHGGHGGHSSNGHGSSGHGSGSHGSGGRSSRRTAPAAAAAPARSLPVPPPPLLATSGLTWVLDDLTAVEDDQDLGELLAARGPSLAGETSEGGLGPQGLQAPSSSPRRMTISRA